MKRSLHLALIQTPLVWQDPVANRESLSKKIATIDQEVDLIVLPEMFTSGFTMQPETVAEGMEGETIAWLRTWANDKQAAIMGSVVIEDTGSFYNRMLFVCPDGAVKTYDKRHTFTLAGEDKVYRAGTEKKVFEYQGWKLCPQICYDLRFPVWSRNIEDYDLLVYVANWPTPRVAAWDALLKARAIENMCYCVGVNRVGQDPNGNTYAGHSAAYDVLGERMTALAAHEEGTIMVSLEKESIERLREKLQFLADRDSFSLEV